MADNSAWVPPTAPKPHRLNALARCFTPRLMLALFTAINFINYLDRGIIPGEPTQIQPFIQHSLHVNSTDVEVGALQSSFIAGYALSSLVFGHLVHYFNPFSLIAVGLSCWCGAVIVSGLSPNYWILLIARIFSGVGEASFQCIVPPWLDDNAPKKSRSLWLAIFFSAIPVGYACGYVFSSQIATATGSWRDPFYIEVLIMAPMAAILPFLKAHATGRNRRMSITEKDGDLVAVPTADIPDPSVWDEFRVVIMNPIYVCLVLGYAAYTFVTAGFANFGPIFLLGLDLFTTETSASLMFGAVVVVAGFFGTAAGGAMLDKWIGKQLEDLRDKNPDADAAEREVEENDCKLLSSTLQLASFAVVGIAFCLSCPFIDNKWIFFLLLGLGILFLFSTTAGVNVAVMASVPARSRSFAIGLSTIIMHGLGDVPSPTIIGLVVDALAPACPDGQGPSSPCGRGRVPGLQWTLFLLVCWLVWTVVFWVGAFLIKKFQVRSKRKKGTKSQPLLGGFRA